MTQEEKAKAYDEAIERAKKCLKDGTITNIAISYIETIFPELKESEDEKVRKEILSALKNANYKGTYDKHIAWLEKQKEQKPVEWSEEDVNAIEYLSALCKVDKKIRPELAEEAVSWLKSLKPQPKQEWSKEDVNAIEYLSALCRVDKKIRPELAEEAISWLKSLKPQPKQEWSEEDEDKIMLIEDSFSDYLDYVREDNSLTKHQKNTTKDDVVGYVNWLKSLRLQKHWKPSEEQMEALGIAIRVGINPRTWEGDALRSLLEHLKAL